MTIRGRATLAVCAVAIVGQAARASAQSPQACRDLLVAHGIGSDRQGANPCQTLATLIATTAPSVAAAAEAILKPDAVAVSSVFSQRDMQPRGTQTGSLAGTAAQGQAIPSVQPAGVAAGTIAAIGTDAGHDALAAVSINPAVLFLADDVSRELAQYSRFLDVTMLVPITKTSTDTVPGSGSLPYFGVRVRVNVTGLAAGDRVWDGARGLITKWISRAGRNVTRVQQALAAAPDLKACVDALLGSDAASVTAGCGSPIALEVNLEEAAQLRDELRLVRAKADSRYFGADIRYDHGDPTLGAVANASGDFLFAGLSYGRRVQTTPEAATVGVRGRLGVRSATLDASSTSEFAAEGGVGVEVVRPIADQEINASAALEFRYGNAAADLRDQLQTNFLVLRGSIVLPVASGNSISLNIGVPVAGGISPTLSVNFNWGLLLNDRVPR